MISDAQKEQIAEVIYDAFPYDGPTDKPAWVPGGNSFTQQRARQAALAILALAAPRNAEATALAEAMWQLLDDMGKGGQSVCLLAKIDARIAYEPFRDKSEPEYDDWMTYDEAKRIRDEYEAQR